MSEILQYVQKDGIFHQLNTLTKILFVIVVSIISIFTISIPMLLLVLGILLLLAALGHLHREILGQFILIAMMSIIMIGLAVITLPNGTVIGTLVPAPVPVIGGSIPITVGGFLLGLIMALRFAVLVIAVQSVHHLHPAPRSYPYSRTTAYSH